MAEKERKTLRVIDRATGNLVAHLLPDPDGITNTWVDKADNGQSTLKFVLPMTSPKWEFITERYAIRADGKEFLLVSREEERDEEGRLISNAQYEESYIELGQKYERYIMVEILSADAYTAMSWLLQDTGWTVGTVDVLGIHDLETEKKSCLANLWEVQKIWGGYLIFDSINKTVSLKQNPGREAPVHFRYGKNLRGIKREIELQVENRLFVYGKDDLGIESVNDGKPYVEDFSYVREQLGLGPTDPIPAWAIKEGQYFREDIDEPQELKDAGQKEVSKRCRPRRHYSIKVVDLREQGGFEGETFDLYDTVRAYDEDFKTIDERLRITRYRYNYFEREQAELEVGDPLETLDEKLAAMDSAARFYSDQLSINKGMRNLLKGLLEIESTKILAANGDLVWDKATGHLISYELDEAGNRTGGEVRLTPKGIVCKDADGTEYDLALSAAGILASKVIINTLYALSTEDGHTQVEADGLKVYDDAVSPKLRAHMGWWMDGLLKRFGFRLFNLDGTRVVFDDRGSLQSWQIQEADNVADGYPLVLKFYIPTEATRMDLVKLNFSIEAFQTYSRGVASGGSTTSGPSSATTTTTEDGGTVTFYDRIIGGAGWKNTNYVYNYWSQKTSYAIPTMQEDHQHDFRNSNWDHWHTFQDHLSHTHGISHTHSIGAHTHGIDYGIYTSTLADYVKIKVDGVDRTADLGGGTGFRVAQADLNLTQFISGAGWHTIELSSTTLGRINALLFIQAFVATAA